LKRRYGRGAYHAAALMREMFGRANPRAFEAPQVLASPQLERRLRDDLAPVPGTVVEERQSQGVVKFVTRFADGCAVESVVLPMATHATVCVSSQVGCRMGCRFCETARMGRVRDLGPAEIVAQVWWARRRFGARVRNVVFMGMGEPLDNYAALVRAVRVLNDQRGLDVALRHMTVSTCGLADGIERLAGERLPGLKLAVSLNAADDALRDRLMPVNRRFPLARLGAALAAYPLGKNDAVMAAYVLIPGVNDNARDVRAVARFLAPLKSRINLIPFNPGDGRFPHEAPDEAQIEEFARRLADAGVFVCRRNTKGRDLMAACGQLGGGYRPPPGSLRMVGDG
jgi:23S rRNA (adenine2503-C2)-methyltransferase